MATTVTQAFADLRSNLEITESQVSGVSSRQQSVRNVLETGLTVSDSFLTGSYARSTMIAPLKEADIDVFFVLDPKYYHHYNGQNGAQAGLLDLVRRVLRKTYTRTPDISRNGQAVTIRFEDFVVDVVPGFNRLGGGFIIPNSVTTSWLSTDPKRHVSIFAEANKAHGGNLIPLIKMLKAWNKTHGGYFRSFHLEVLALEILSNVTISSMSSGVRYVFDKARELVSKKNLDPAGYGDDVGRYIQGQDQIRDAVSKFQTAYERAVKAEEAERRGNYRDAIETWRTVFDHYFPVYG